MNLGHILDSEILPRVDKASRYLGTEWGAIHKDASTVDVRLALAFPDLYDLGLGNLGLHILYASLNERPDVWGERVYAVGADLEAMLRERGLPLFGLESRDALSAMDGIGFTLQSELTYTNILNMIDLAGLALRSADRAEDDPLLFAGGPSVFNPEPLSPFLDFFVIGDGEEVIHEIADVLKSVRGRAARLRAMAALVGVYVPALYPTLTTPEGRILPDVERGGRVTKRIMDSLEKAPFPEQYIVPFTRQVHDRVSLEVLRGCTQGCRFCQAGMTTRPARERSIEAVGELLDRTLTRTGYEEVSLVSLSTCDHSRVKELVSSVVQRAAPERVAVSLPSLRLDSFSVELADMVAGIRRTGLTFAPEAASPRLRALINKWIPDEALLQMSAQAFELGWDHIKLYFMIGLPTERDDDVEAIADLTLRALDAGRESNRRAQVNTGVSTFVPKPFTPLQWAAQLDRDEVVRRQRMLSERFRRTNGVKFGRHTPASTWIEGLITRSDRRAGDLIEAAWRQGARFDAWDEQLDAGAWERAIEETGFDVADALRERSLDEPLPWDHIDVMIEKQWFADDWRRALELKHAEDCRHHKCVKCGVIDRRRDLCASMLRTSVKGRAPEAAFVPPPPPAELGGRPPRAGEPPARSPEVPAVQRLVFRTSITGSARFLSHLEAVNAWIRVLRRAGAPIVYSQGFHPHPKLAFSSARPVGIESRGEYMDISLNRRVDPEALRLRLRLACPRGMDVLSVVEVGLKEPALMSRVSGNDYLFYVPDEEAADRVQALLASGEVVAERVSRGKRKRNKRRQVDIRPMIERVATDVDAEPRSGRLPLMLSLRTVDGVGAKPLEIIDALGYAVEEVEVVRLDTHFSPPLGSLA